MVLLVLGVAAAMRRAGNVRTKWLRGRALSVGRLRFHTNTRLAGTVTIVVGILKFTTGGLLTMPDLLSASLMERISKVASQIDAVRRPLCTQDTTVLAESFDEAIPARRGRNSRAGPTLTLLLHLAGQGAEPFPDATICTFTE